MGNSKQKELISEITTSIGVFKLEKDTDGTFYMTAPAKSIKIESHQTCEVADVLLGTVNFFNIYRPKRR